MFLCLGGLLNGFLVVFDVFFNVCLFLIVFGGFPMVFVFFFVVLRVVS